LAPWRPRPLDKEATQQAIGVSDVPALPPAVTPSNDGIHTINIVMN
jgi:hypothetical protein